MKYAIRKRSERKKLRDKIGALHLKILKFKRGHRSEFTGKEDVVLGRFHILDVARFPRLEFHEENILLSEWFGVHFDWHHNYYKAQEIEKRIMELRGKDYKEKLMMLDRMQPRMTTLRLQMIYEAFKQAVKEIEAGPKGCSLET